MQVRVAEPRHHKMPAQINHLRLRTFQLLDVRILPHRLNPFPAHRNRLLAHHRTKLPRRRHASVNIPVNVDRVRLGLGIFRLGRSPLRRRLCIQTDGAQDNQEKTQE